MAGACAANAPEAAAHLNKASSVSEDNGVAGLFFTNRETRLRASEMWRSSAHAATHAFNA